MEWLIPLGLILGSFAVLMFLGFPIGIAFLLVSFVGSAIVMGIGALPSFALSCFRSVSSFSLLPIPLFVFLGTYFFLSGMSKYLFVAVDACFGRMRARLNYVAIVGGGLFGALSGSALAGTAVFGKVLGSEMRRRNYHKEFQIGPIVSGGTLAMIIPPSLIIVVLGSQATISISKLLIGGLVPGIFLILGYSIWNLIRSAGKPEFSPVESLDMSAADRLRAILVILPFALIVFLVTGIIWIGVATPSESAAMGCLGLILLSTLYKRKFDWYALREGVKEAILVTGLVMLIIMSASAFSRLLAFSGATPGFVNFMTKWSDSPFTILILSQIAILFLGMWLDSIAIIVLIAPLLAPVIEAVGIDPIWFGLVTMTNLLLGGKSPPFGLCLFVLKGVNPDLSMSEIYRAVVPYLIVDALVIVVILLFPKVFLFLPYMLD